MNSSLDEETLVWFTMVALLALFVLLVAHLIQAKNNSEGGVPQNLLSHLADRLLSWFPVASRSALSKKFYFPDLLKYKRYLLPISTLFSKARGILFILAPIWMPIAGAYLTKVIVFLIGKNILGFLIFWSALIGPIILGLYSIIGSTHIDKTLKWFFSILYIPVALFTLFFFGWGAMMILEGHN